MNVTAESIGPALSNPLQALRSTPAPRTMTLPSRTVYHEAQAALKPLLSNIQTQEHLDALLYSLVESNSID